MTTTDTTVLIARALKLILHIKTVTYSKPFSNKIKIIIKMIVGKLLQKKSVTVPRNKQVGKARSASEKTSWFLKVKL